MTLIERIKKGEEAIAEAKARGQDVSDWEAHLNELKKVAFNTTDTTIVNGMPTCWNCGATMSRTFDIYGRAWWACWECAVEV